MKALDFVRPNEKLNKVGIISEVNENTLASGEKYRTAMIMWLGGSDGLKGAWWDEDEVVVIDNLANLLGRGFSNIGVGRTHVDNEYPIRVG